MRGLGSIGGGGGVSAGVGTHGLQRRSSVGVAGSGGGGQSGIASRPASQLLAREMSVGVEEEDSKENELRRADMYAIGKRQADRVQRQRQGQPVKLVLMADADGLPVKEVRAGRPEGRVGAVCVARRTERL
jgi:hypothetical protein